MTRVYRRRYTDYADELKELQTLCSPEQGDARFDALVDYLIDFFQEDDSTKKLIIAAQDMPTVYYLQQRLEDCFPDTKILTFKQERNRNAESDLENTETNESEIEKDDKCFVEQFWMGDAQILIAHNDAREAFNLQIADALVFYSLPWNPVDMEQWPGRVSRLGLRKKKTVEIVTLVLRDLLDEQIADLYQSLNIFDKPLDIEQNQNILNDITKQIRQTVLYGNVQVVKPKIQSKMDEWNETLIHIVPKNEAIKLGGNLQDTVIEPVIKSGKPTDYPKEDALNGWLGRLQEDEFCYKSTYFDDNYRDAKNPRYYRFQVIDKHRKAPFPIPVLNGEPISTIPFVVKRSHIQLPPRDLVPIYKKDRQNKYEIPLQFFNFGSPLHDELVKTFAGFFHTPKLYSFNVQYCVDENIALESGRYLIGILTTQRKRFEHKSLLADLPKSENKTQDEMRQSEQRRLETGLQADDRFLDLLLSGGLEIHGHKYRDNQWKRVDTNTLYPFLTVSPDKITDTKTQTIPDNYVKQFTQLASESTVSRWQQDFHPLLEKRIETLRNELQIREQLLQRRIEVEQQKIESDSNDWNVRMTYIPNQKRYAEQLQLVRKYFTIREQYLTDSVAAANRPECVCKAVIHLQVTIK